MISGGLVLTVGHKARYIEKAPSPLEPAYLAFVFVRDKYPGVTHIQVVDVKVLDPNVKEGGANDIAVLTVSHETNIGIRVIRFKGPYDIFYEKLCIGDLCYEKTSLESMSD